MKLHRSWIHFRVLVGTEDIEAFTASRLARVKGLFRVRVESFDVSGIAAGVFSVCLGFE